MLYEKKKLIAHKSIWSILLLLGIIIPIILAYTSTNDMMYIIILLFVYGDIFVFAFFISSLLLSYKVFDFNENEIVVYAGWYQHYIKVNGQKLDEHNTLLSFTPIMLSCTLEDGTDIHATITTTNRIMLKINNRLYNKRK